MNPCKTALFTLLFFCCPRVYAAESSPNLVLIYKGPGACNDCPESVGKVLKEMGRQVQYVKPGMLTEKNFSRAVLYVQPGGSDRVLDTLEALSEDEIANLREFVAAGGRYLGICAGGYLAGSETDDDDGNMVPAYGLLPAVMEQELETSDPVVTEITWQGTGREVYYQAGPWFDQKEIPNAESFGTYKGSGHSMALIAGYGRGKVGVMGPHFEAPDSWFTEDHLPIPEESSVRLLKDFISKLLN